MEPTSYALEARGLTKIYRTSAGTPHHALHDVTMRVPAGQVIGVVGAAGAGKTVLLKLLGGVESATAGAALIAGHTVSVGDPRSHNDIALALAHPQPHNQHESAWDYLAATANVPARTAYLKLRLRDLEIADTCDRPFSAFPLAVQHALAVIRALAAQTPVLLLDEPTAALDQPLAATVETWIVEHARAFNPTIILASRRLDLVRRLCDRMIMLHQGQQIADLSVLDLASLLEGGWYSIEIQGHIDPRWKEWFGELLIQHEAAGRTLLVGRVVDQAALNGLLNKIYNLGLPLLAVTRGELDAEQLCTHFKQQSV